MPFIKTGYRVNFTLSETLQSLFLVHNESGNIWTHLTFLLIVLLTIVYVIMWVSHTDALSSFVTYLRIKHWNGLTEL